MPSRRDLARSVSVEVGGGLAELVPDPDRADAWTLLVGGTPQSHVDLADPTRLEFEYVRWLAHVTAVLPGLRDVLHLGGGGLTLARYLAATRPQTRQRVVELDGELVGFVRARLPLPRRPRIVVRVEDARSALATARPADHDLVVLDAFEAARVPAHLTSVEFVSLAAVALRPEGCFAANLADGGRLGFARAMVATVAGVFPHLGAISLPATLRGRRFGNVVVIGSGAPLDVPKLSRLLAAEAFPARLLVGSDLRDFAAEAVVIRDATAGPSPLPPPGWLSDLAR